MEKIKEKMYTLSGRINEVPFSEETTNINKTLLSLKPDFIHCDTYITLSSGEGVDKTVTERKLNLTESKRIFLNEDVRAVFIQNLVMEYN